MSKNHPEYSPGMGGLPAGIRRVMETNRTCLKTFRPAADRLLKKIRTALPKKKGLRKQG